MNTPAVRLNGTGLTISALPNLAARRRVGKAANASVRATRSTREFQFACDDYVRVPAIARRPEPPCTPSANSSIIFRLNAGMSSGLRDETMPRSTTTS